MLIMYPMAFGQTNRTPDGGELLCSGSLLSTSSLGFSFQKSHLADLAVSLAIGKPQFGFMFHDTKKGFESNFVGFKNIKNWMYKCSASSFLYAVA